MHIFGTDFSFDIEIRYGAGAFVCGEETALIHSMEGLRGEATAAKANTFVPLLFSVPILLNHLAPLNKITGIFA